MGGEKAIGYWDEDSVTMATEAALDSMGDTEPNAVDGVFLASTTPPYKEIQMSSMVAALLDLPRKQLVQPTSPALCAVRRRQGKGWQLIVDGVTTLQGKLLVNMDGGLKCFGHPVGASGIRMHYEIWKQFQGKAGPRQLKDPHIGLTHTLGAVVSCVSIVGTP